MTPLQDVPEELIESLNTARDAAKAVLDMVDNATEDETTRDFIKALCAREMIGAYLENKKKTELLEMDDVVKIPGMPNSRITIAKLIRDGEIWGKKIGGKWQIRKDSVDAYLGR